MFIQVVLLVLAHIHEPGGKETSCLVMTVQAREVPRLGEPIYLEISFSNKCRNEITIHRRFNIAQGDLEVTLSKDGCTWKSQTPRFCLLGIDEMFYTIQPGGVYRGEILLHGDRFYEGGIYRQGTYDVKLVYLARILAMYKSSRPNLFEGSLEATTKLSVQAPKPATREQRLNSLKHFKRTGSYDDENLGSMEVLSYFRYVPDREAADLVAELFPKFLSWDAVDVLVHYGSREHLERVLAYCTTQNPYFVPLVEEGIKRLDRPPCPPCLGIFSYPEELTD